MGGGSVEPRHDLQLRFNTTKPKGTLWGIVDMGSNGIRFSITDLAEPTARVLPTVYSYRNGLSLYEAQYDDDGNQIPIPEEVIESIIGALLRFEIYCADFGVPFHQIRIIATEATRKAKNSKDLRHRIKKETGLVVELLSYSEEGLTGAWGIASSASQVRGLVMDLGGGSTQITWIITDAGKMKTSPKGAFSYPYGAAALTQRLAQIEKGKTQREIEDGKLALRKEMEQNFLQAYNDLEIPEEMIEEAKREGGFPLYLAGGGFRGWGYLLLYEAQTHHRGYPISIINGFVADKKDFEDTEHLKDIAREAKKIFRVSDRRRAQVPAVAFLVNVLSRVIPHGIKAAHFCQGGVREGALFRKLPPEIRMQSPIEVATAPYARPLCGRLSKLLNNALPFEVPDQPPPPFAANNKRGKDNSKRIPESVTSHILNALANMMYYHADMSKELAATAALYTTSTGVLANAHGTNHTNRALIALMLRARYEGDLPPREEKYRRSLQKILTPAEAWWCNYLGAVALVLSRAFPAGTEDDVDAIESTCDEDGSSDESADHEKEPHHIKPKLKVKSKFSDALGKLHNKRGLVLTFIVKMRGEKGDDPMKVQETLEHHAKKIVKVGKKKHWIQRNEEKRHRHARSESGDTEDSEADFVTVEEPGEDPSDGPGDEPVEDPGWGMKVKVEIKVKHKHHKHHDN